MKKSIYNQLMEVMAHLDSVEKNTSQKISELNREIFDLKEKNAQLKQENIRPV